eukprot:Blabericola_migrator_1__571@NODE_1141_length_5302_cov_97_735435_g583_i1_p2_GENE_NODE_1141_length_5302_cov_97_735435_g583_i1NODE_1141_length_5302_cov_97_735435_g583_i1_p2_ORF_typecomplete_len398_score37_31Kelch_4/PF13418_6/2_1e08Kelch_4/PF13418_6/94Kelch_3/PF13415_6/2_5e02Kelch_3/PF13415_6/6_1e07Kelch_3/PF13415_6/14Kelch_6/PF13964_6/0_00017Kelch_6/PF13964_6/2_5e02Kelch_2/PF07646_15/0_00064Kelch_2/PF07646_15/2_2e02Kelch_1/PF01344_25/0_03Kelch_1/PF01344_25/2_6e03Kelch_1/PF01344_25/5_6e03Kelch_5/PF1
MKFLCKPLCLTTIDNAEAIELVRGAIALCAWENYTYIYTSCQQIVELDFDISLRTDDIPSVKLVKSRIILDSQCIDTENRLDGAPPYQHRPSARCCAAMIGLNMLRKPAFEGKPTLLLTGGAQEDRTLNDVWLFDTSTGTWIDLETPCPVPLAWHQMNLIDETTVAVSSWSCPSCLWMLDLGARRWYPLHLEIGRRVKPNIAVRRQLRHPENLQIIIGGGMGMDHNVLIAQLTRAKSGYVASDVVMTLDNHTGARLWGAEGIYDEFQIAVGGFRLKESAVCEVLDLINDRFVYRGNPFDDKPVPIKETMTNHPIVILKFVKTFQCLFQVPFQAGLVLSDASGLPQGLTFTRYGEYRMTLLKGLLEAKTAQPHVKEPLLQFLADEAPQNVITIVLSLL